MFASSNHSALRCSRERFPYRAVFHHTSPKPFPQQLQYPTIRNPLLHKHHQLLLIDAVAGRDGPWSCSLSGASPLLPFRVSGLTEPAWLLVPIPPRRTRRADFLHRAPQIALTATTSDSRMTSFRVRQFEPRTALEIAPVQPVSLAAPTQHSNPLQLNLVPNDIEFWFAMRESKVLVETIQHQGQLTLLISSLPVSMLRQPFLATRQKLTNALLTRKADYREHSTAIRPTYMLESQKLKGFRLRAVLRFPFGSEASKENQPRLLVGQFQIESRKTFPQISIEPFRVPFVLETCHKIIRKPSQICLTLAPLPKLLLEPQVENKMQIDIGQKRAEYSLYAKDNLGHFGTLTTP